MKAAAAATAAAVALSALPAARMKTAAAATAAAVALSVLPAAPGPAWAQSDTGTDPTSSADHSEDSDAAPSARVSCEEASEIFYVLCTVYKLITIQYVDRVSASSLADAAARGVTNADMPPTSTPRPPCALPAAEFERVCTEIDRIANTARAAWLASEEMVASLRDLRSLLLPPKFSWVVESRPRARSGLGLELSLTDGDSVCAEVSDSCRLVIADVHPGSPADEAGLMADDFVIGWNGPLTPGLSCRRAALLDHFHTGARVKVEVERQGVTLVKTIRAARMRVPPVRSRVVDGRIGYLHIDTFSENVHEQTLTALNELLDTGVGRLVLDLRGNPGGSLLSSSSVAGLFLPDESVVVRMTHKSVQTSYISQGWETAPLPAMPPLAVAVDGWSASASEIVTGALVDHGRATAVGSTTYGKGSAQIYTLMKDDIGRVRGVLALTTGRWVTPSGHSPAGGFTPDVRLYLPPCMHPDEVSRQAAAVIRPYVGGIEIMSSPPDGRSYKPGETVTLAVSLTTPVIVDTTGDAIGDTTGDAPDTGDAPGTAPTMGLNVAGQARRASYRPDAPDSDTTTGDATTGTTTTGDTTTTLIFEYAITAEDARAASADAGVCGATDTDNTTAGGVTAEKTDNTTIRGVTAEKIGIDADSLDAGAATIRNAAGLDAVLTHSALEPGSSADHTPRFTDIAHCEHREAIEIIAEAGVTSGCNPPDNDRFCPDRPVTRAETASFLARAVALPGTSDDYFDDDNDSTHEDSINRLALAGITSGCASATARRFCPRRSVSRAQAATLLIQAFKPLPQQPPQHARGEFTDTAHSPHREAIELLTEAGIGFACNPPDNDRFCPDRPVTRAEMAELLARAMNRTAGHSSSTATDRRTAAPWPRPEPSSR